MFSVCNRFVLGWVVLIVYPSFSAEFFNVCKFVDGKGVSFVERGAVEGFCCGDGLLGCLILNEGETVVRLETLWLG